MNNKRSITVKKNERGSVTLEASLVLPIFIFIFLFCYGILMMFSGQQLISHALLQSAESLSLDSFASEKIGDTGLESAKSAVNMLYESIISNSENKEYFSSNEKWYSGADVSEEAKKRFLGYFSGGDESKAASVLSIVGINDGWSGMTFHDSYITDDGDLHVIVNYEQKFLFDFGGLTVFDRKMEVIAHMW